jgi:hypothetical protein
VTAKTRAVTMTKVGGEELWPCLAWLVIEYIIERRN